MSSDENNTQIWINLNQKMFLIKTSEESSSFGTKILLFVTTANSVYSFSRFRLSVRGYIEVNARTEVLNIVSVKELMRQLNQQKENLRIPENVNNVIFHLLEDITNRLEANELWNSRFVTFSDQDILNETSIRWRWERLQFNVIKRWIDQNDKRILDVPSGSGRFSIALARENPAATVFGIDLLGKAVTLAKDGARLHKVTNVKFRQADVLVLPEILRHEPKFDVLISIGLAQNMTEDDLTLLVEAFLRITKPGGKIIISVPNGHSPIYRLWKWVVGKNLKYRFGLERNISPQEVFRLFVKQGLEDIEIEGADPLYGLRKMYRVDPKTGNAIPFWWSQYSRRLGEFLDKYFIDPLDRTTKGSVSRHLGNDFIVKGKISSLLNNAPVGIHLTDSDIQ